MLHQCTYSSPLSTISIRNCMIPWWQMTEKIPVSSMSCIAPNFDFDAIGWAFFHARQPSVMNTDEGPDCQWMLLNEKCSYKWHSYLCLMLSPLPDIGILIDLLSGEVVVAVEALWVPLKVVVHSWEWSVPITHDNKLDWSFRVISSLQLIICHQSIT